MTRSNPAIDERDDLAELRRRRDTLTRRLEDGFRRIGEAELAGRDVTDWETFWISLLEEYEAVCDDLREQAWQEAA